MKKITVTVDGTGSVSLDSSDAGYYGEHLVTCLEITPAVTFSENCEYYKMNIDGYLSERLTPTDGKITYTLPGSALRPPSISCQLIGYKLIDSIPVMVIRSAVFTLNVAVSPLSESPEIINGSLQPLETALAECGNTVAAAEKLLEEITDAQSATRAELENLKDSAAASAAEAAASAASVNSGNYYKKSETYSKDAADKQFAERSSENSANPSSVEYAKAVWIKQDDTGTNGAAFLWDDYGENSNVLWSSEKTMETVRETIKDAQADYYKKDETYAKSETYSKDEIYTKAETNKQFAERSSEDSIASSSVAFAQFLWIKGNDGGDDSYAELNDSHSADQNYLWSSQKTMEEVKQQFCNALKGLKTGGTVRIDDVSPANGELNVSVVRKNLIPYPYAQSTLTENGVTFTVGTDGSVTANGTATADTTFPLTSSASYTVPKGSYTLSGCPTGGSGSTYALVLGSNDYKDIGSGVSRTYASDMSQDIFIEIYSGYTANNLVFKPQLETGASATAYTPYVSDLSAVTVSRYGKNLLSYPYYEKSTTRNGITFTVNADGTVTANGTATGDSYIELQPRTTVLKAGQYFLSGCPDGGSYSTYTVYLSKTGGGLYKADTGNGVSVNMEEDAQTIIAISVAKGTTVSNLIFKPQLESGTAATGYEPFKASIYYPNTDGTVDGVTAISPATTLTTNNSGVVIKAEYNRDINKAFAELQQAIISLGGNL